MSNQLTALLPMKAHSSRVPGKNFKRISGKPLFRWILDTLLDLGSIERVVINTDAQHELRSAGLEVSDRVILRERAPHLCGDEVSMNLVLEDDIAAYGEGHYLMTHTTNPLLSIETIGTCIESYFRAIESTDQAPIDSLFTVNRHQTRFYRADASPINHDPDNLIPTQDLDPYFEENSCLYIFSKASFERTGARIGAHPMLVETPKIESVDIDEREDWLVAEQLLKTHGASR